MPAVSAWDPTSRKSNASKRQVIVIKAKTAEPYNGVWNDLLCIFAHDSA